MLNQSLIISKKYNNKTFESWIKLELNGYYSSNNELKENTILPEYRTVVGQYYDIYGRQLYIDDPKLTFIREERLRNSVLELEKLVNKDEILSISNPDHLSIIKENLGVEVSELKFSSANISGILQAIRTKLSDWLFDMDKEKGNGNMEKNPIIKKTINHWDKEMEKNIWLEIESQYGRSKRVVGKRINFIRETFRREIIFRDIAQSYYLANIGFSKPALILAGSVIEELLRNYIIYKGFTASGKTFNSYIKTCEDNNLLKMPLHGLNDSNRHFRNLVHMEKEQSKRHTISKTTAIGAVTSIFTLVNDFE